VIVVGDVMLDAYLEGTARRLSREGPVPVVAVDSCTEAPGGAANVAVNLAALGADTSLIGVVGDDPDGDRLRELVSRADVDTRDVVVAHDHATIAKRRIIADGQLLLRVDQGP